MRHGLQCLARLIRLILGELAFGEWLCILGVSFCLGHDKRGSRARVYLQIDIKMSTRIFQHTSSQDKVRR